MGLGRGRLPRRLLWLGAILWQPESGGLTVDWTTILALVVAFLLVI